MNISPCLSLSLVSLPLSLSRACLCLRRCSDDSTVHAIRSGLLLDVRARGGNTDLPFWQVLEMEELNDPSDWADVDVSLVVGANDTATLAAAFQQEHRVSARKYGQTQPSLQNRERPPCCPAASAAHLCRAGQRLFASRCKRSTPWRKMIRTVRSQECL